MKKRLLLMAFLLGILATNMGSTSSSGGCTSDSALQTIDQNNPFSWIRWVLGGQAPGS